MLSDFRIAARSLIKSPGYSIIVLATLALGIGVNVSMFTLLNTLLFQKVPFHGADRLVSIVSVSPQNPLDQFSFLELQDISAQAAGPGKAFESVTTYSMWDDTLSEEGKTAEQFESIDASADFFKTFGVRPLLGRAYTEAEEVPGRNQVALLSYAFWQSHFGGDPGIVGRVLRLNAEDVTVIGVMPSDFTAPLFFFGRIDLWRPITIPPHIVNDRNHRFFFAVGRLNPGATQAQAAAELDTLSQRWAHDYPSIEKGRVIGLVAPNKLEIDGTGVFIMWLMYGVGVAVLAVACANIANLQLARASANARELAIRSAIGASRLRLVLHQMAEPFLFSLGGGALGLLVAWWANRLMGAAFLMNNEPMHLSIDFRVLTVALSTAAATAFLFGLLPAWYASRTDSAAALKQGARGSTSGRSQDILRRALTVGEVAVAVALLSGVGAMIRGLGSILEHTSGWDTGHVLTANIHLPEQSVYLTDQSRRNAIEKLQRRLGQIPGAESATVSSTVPLFGPSKDTPFEVEGQTYEDAMKEPLGDYTMVNPSFFNTLGIKILDGQNIPDGLKADGRRIVLVNEALARKFWPSGSAVGKRIADRDEGMLVWREIVGVVSNVSYPLNVTNPITPYQVYKPIVNEPWGNLYISIRGTNPSQFRSEVVRAVADVDPDVAVQQVYTVDEAEKNLNHNLFVIQDVLAAFAGLALLLASLGLYGVISYLVAQRTNEIGIRMALGASRGNVLQLILRYGAILATMGAFVGAVAAYLLDRLLNSAVPNWVETDIGSIGWTAAVLLVVALLACIVPAFRATRIDPIVAMRVE